MSITTAMQSLGAGIGAWFGGLLLGTGPNGEILGYGMNGWIAAALTLFGMIWIVRVVSNTSAQPAPVARGPVDAAVQGEV
jgi:predicted MFS family arabinose efflux permease